MEQMIDYAIVGGGIAGTYCAWRLKKKHPGKTIFLFENSNRIGGRLLTARFPNSNLKVELGGMRYLPKDHPIFHHLVQELALKTERFPMGYDKENDKEKTIYDPTGMNNFAYFRGKHLRIRDFGNSEKIPYQVRWTERNMTPDDLQLQTLQMLVPEWDKLTKLDQWFDIKILGEGGDFLWKYGFWNLVYRLLSPEAFQFLKYGSGYDTNVSNGNAVALLPTGTDYSSGNEYLTLEEGMMTLPVRLCEEFESSGGKVLYQYRLDSIERENDHNYTLSFAKTRTESGRRERTADTGEFESIKTAKIILALPRAALERIRWKPFQENIRLKENLDSVVVQEAIKIFLEYDYAWWKSLGLFRGRSISDLPIRQTFYFTDLQEMDMPDPFKVLKKPSLLMASYSDIESVPFWRGLEGAENDEPYGGPDDGYRASKLMVQEVHKQVMAIHGQSELPPPSRAAYYDWADLPYGGAWHCWKPGYKYNTIIHEMRHPVKEEKVYFCGEAYSGKQGWAEGALETAELLLTSDLDPEDRLDPLIATRLRTTDAEKSRFRDSKGRSY
ncbi:MAG: FAD-dependent oxidoreductase [Nitrososphaera sp.]|nr:FAD-dependent oxidoreductase [Nitrososphaera sp.]